jgi:hypothetical protein
VLTNFLWAESVNIKKRPTEFLFVKSILWGILGESDFGTWLDPTHYGKDQCMIAPMKKVKTPD